MVQCKCQYENLDQSDTENSTVLEIEYINENETSIICLFGCFKNRTVNTSVYECIDCKCHVRHRFIPRDVLQRSTGVEMFS